MQRQPSSEVKRKKSKKQRSYRVQWDKQPDSWWLPILFYIYLPTAIAYLVWRSSVINWHVWYGPLVYLAELYGLTTSILFLCITRKMYWPAPPPKQNRKPKVDALVPTYAEGLHILEPVVIGALKMRGVSRVLVLDDGNRSEVASMAKRLGAKYFPRTTNENAKAGNLNNGLLHTKAEFIVTLDADHIPSPEFIEQTIGYFKDPSVAFVQTPQTFYNTSSFLFRNRHGREAGWSEQIMFYDCIQPAKNHWNSAFFVGTSATLRRSALDDVGGFATGTATEDIHTSIKLHARGWQSVFLPKPLAFGLEAENFKEFYKQRRRWAAGSLGLLFRSPDSPLWARGLSVSQRLNYLSATLAHLQGLQKICYFFAPLIALFTQIPPIHGALGRYSIIFSGFLVFGICVTAAHSRGTYHLIYTEAYAFANLLPQLGGLKGILKVQKKFAVSKKSDLRREKTWLNDLLWALTWIAGIGVARGLWYLVRDMHRSGIVVSSTIFISINLTVLLTFLVHLRAYETGDKHIKNFNDLNPTKKYKQIIFGPTTKLTPELLEIES